MFSLKDLNPMARWALLAHLIWWTAEGVGDAFVSVYTLRLTSTFEDAAWFQLWKYLAVPFGFLLGATFARRFSGAAAYRAGIAGYGLFYALVLAMGEGVLSWKLELGLLWGLAMGFYWLGWQLLILDLTHDRQRDALLSLASVTLFTSQLIGPPLAGFYLAGDGSLAAYGQLFAVLAGLFGLAVLATWSIRTKPLKSTGGFWYLMKLKWKPAWKASLWVFFFQGFNAVMRLFLAPLLAYRAFGSEVGTGSYAGLAAGSGIAASLIASRVLRPQRRNTSILVAGIGLSVCGMILAMDLTFFLLALYGILTAILRPFYNPPFFATMQRIINDSPELEDHRSDWLALRDFPIMFGRVVAAMMVILFIQDAGTIGLKLFAGILVVAPVLNYLIIRPYIATPPEKMDALPAPVSRAEAP